MNLAILEEEASSGPRIPRRGFKSNGRSEIELGVKRFLRGGHPLIHFGHPHRNRRSVHIVLPSYSGGFAKIAMDVKDLAQFLTCSDRGERSTFLRTISPREGRPSPRSLATETAPHLCGRRNFRKVP
jgi:hypothetical protein